jgi:ketosteroid isomerase-like protein
MSNTEVSIIRLLDEAAVRDATARFADSATRGDYAAFRALWADDAEWVIGGTEGQPLERRARGVDDIVSMYRTLREERDYFVQFAIPGSIEVNGDVATARCICYEAARGPGESYYRNTGVWSDRLRRSGEGWLFTSRTYQYLWLDLSPFSGDVFPGDKASFPLATVSTA